MNHEYPDTEQRQKQIVSASWVSIGGNAVLSAAKIFIGLLGGSLAVVGDGIDSATDIITSVITLLTAHLLDRPPNVRYPYGYEKADTVATKALSFVIFFAGAQLLISTIQKLLQGKTMAVPAVITIYITVVSIIGKLLLAYHQYRVGRKTQSSMLIANAKNMRNDVLISSTVLVGLVFTLIFRLPIIDSILALAVSVWIMKTALGIFMETFTDLMDGLKDPVIYEKVIAAIERVEGASNPHRIRLRKLGHLYMMEADIEVDPNSTVLASHQIAHNVEESVRREVANIYDAMIHVEPAGDSQETEKFGVSRKNLTTPGRTGTI